MQELKNNILAFVGKWKIEALKGEKNSFVSILRGDIPSAIRILDSVRKSGALDYA